MKVLLTGGSGFIGGHAAEELARRGHDVVALVRRSSNRKHLETVPRLTFAYGAVDDAGSLGDAVAGVDAVLHAAGLVKARNKDEFHAVNAQGTENLLLAVKERAPKLRRFVLVSSLAATSPSPDGLPVKNDVRPQPVTDYGWSKLAGERIAKAHAADVPITIIRPPMVYGPRDNEVLQLFQWADKRILPFVGTPDGRLSMIYGPDCARACVLALEADVPSGSAYFVTDGRIYTRADIGRALEQAVGKKSFVSFPIPERIVRGVAFVSEGYGRARKRAVMLTQQKVDELLEEWICDGSDAETALGFKPEVDWFEGAKRTGRWYRDNGWL